MKHKIIMSAALIISMTGMTGCFFFPAEEELLEPPTVAIEDIAYSTYTAKQKNNRGQDRCDRLRILQISV